MKSPTVVFIASIIPGLGLWLVGKRRHAVIAFVLVLGAAILFLFSWSETFVVINFLLLILLWVLQIRYAIHAARIAREIASGKIKPARKSPSRLEMPSNLGRWEKAYFKAKEIVRQQLDEGEVVLEAFPAFEAGFLPGSTSEQLYYLGLLQDKIVFVAADFWGKPAGVAEIDLASVQKVTVKHGLLQDTLIIAGISKKPIKKVRASRWLRPHVDNFAVTFEKQLTTLHKSAVY